MTGLMILPTEIRHIIYQYCSLIIDEGIIPYPTSSTHDGASLLGGHQVSRKLDVALVAINKHIHHEVSPFLYSQNTWRMTSPKVTRKWIGHVFCAQPSCSVPS